MQLRHILVVLLLLLILSANFACLQPFAGVVVDAITFAQTTCRPADAHAHHTSRHRLLLSLLLLPLLPAIPQWHGSRMMSLI
jgi:hypothetical protein